MAQEVQRAPAEQARGPEFKPQHYKYKTNPRATKLGWLEQGDEKRQNKISGATVGLIMCHCGPAVVDTG
jgi:hypothetical protein